MNDEIKNAIIVFLACFLTVIITLEIAKFEKHADRKNKADERVAVATERIANSFDKLIK